jgi:aspartate aminotransferase
VETAERNLIPFFDIAYQGFASGDPAADAWPVRYFASQPGQELLCAQSFAKNFGLYNERAGCFSMVVADAAVVPAIKSQINLQIRSVWSNPPAHGARIVQKVLSTPELKQQWLGHIREMSGRIKEMRAALRDHLEKMGTPGTWDHVTTQIGMFSFLGISEDQSLYMREAHKIFLLKSGRINVCGLNTKNVEQVAKAIDDAVRNAKL